MYCDTARHEQEWYDETSSDLKNMLIMGVTFEYRAEFKCEMLGTQLVYNRLSHLCKQFRLFCVIRPCTAATVELRTLCDSVERNATSVVSLSSG